MQILSTFVSGDESVPSHVCLESWASVVFLLIWCCWCKRSELLFVFLLCFCIWIRVGSNLRLHFQKAWIRKWVQVFLSNVLDSSIRAKCQFSRGSSSVRQEETTSLAINWFERDLAKYLLKESVHMIGIVRRDFDEWWMKEYVCIYTGIYVSHTGDIFLY